MSFAEDRLESLHASSRKYLPLIGRTLTVATFMEDGMRMWYQWDDQVSYLRTRLPFGWLFVQLFVFLNFIFQLGASGAVIAKKKTEIAVGILMSIIIMQSMVYTVLWSWSFFLRNLALVGGLILLLADSQGGKKMVYAGVPELDTAGSKTYFQLFGRVMLVVMFFTLIHWDMTITRYFFALIASALMVLVVIGYKTKLSAFALSMFLFATNFLLNAWFWLPDWSPNRDFYKYDFFQTLSVCGGLLLLTTLGAGEISVDDKTKKDF